MGGFDPTASPSYLLPAMAAVFLGTAVVAPGQFNPIGTLIGIYFLEMGIIGLQILGYSGWVQEAFYGVGPVAAVTIAPWSATAPGSRDRLRGRPSRSPAAQTLIGRHLPIGAACDAIRQGRHGAGASAGRRPA